MTAFRHPTEGECASREPALAFGSMIHPQSPDHLTGREAVRRPLTGSGRSPALSVGVRGVRVGRGRSRFGCLEAFEGLPEVLGECIGATVGVPSDGTSSRLTGEYRRADDDLHAE